jgi:hypothetical protein
VAGGELPQVRSENYGIYKICDYIADIETNTKITDNSARKQSNAGLCDGGQKTLAAAERDPTGLLADPASPPVVKNRKLIPAAQRKSPAHARNRTPPRPATPPPRNYPPTSSTSARRPRCYGPSLAAVVAYRWCGDCWRRMPSPDYRATSTPNCATDGEYRDRHLRCPSSSTRSTPPRHPYPATRDPLPISLPHARHLTRNAYPVPKI